MIYIKKTLFINRNYVKNAIRILNVKTEEEAVNRALEIVLEEDAIINAHKKIGGADTIKQVYK